jgi:hypothetical protein
MLLAGDTRRWSITVPLVWVFSLWGTTDLLYANVNAIRLHLDPGEFGAAYYIPTMWVPLLPTHHDRCHGCLCPEHVERPEIRSASARFPASAMTPVTVNS